MEDGSNCERASACATCASARETGGEHAASQHGKQSARARPRARRAPRTPALARAAPHCTAARAQTAGRRSVPTSVTHLVGADALVRVCCKLPRGVNLSNVSEAHAPALCERVTQCRRAHAWAREGHGGFMPSTARTHAARSPAPPAQRPTRPRTQPRSARNGPSRLLAHNARRSTGCPPVAARKSAQRRGPPHHVMPAPANRGGRPVARIGCFEANNGWCMRTKQRAAP